MGTDDVMAAIRQEVNRRIEASLILIQNEAKVLLSVPAPRRRVISRTGVPYYRAATPATSGAPPRKLNGRLRSSIGREMDREQMVGRVGTNIIYARRQELVYNHKFFEPALRNLASRLSGLSVQGP